MLAVVTAEGWVLIVAAVGAVVVKVMEKFFDRWAALKAAERAAETVAAKVEVKADEVKTALERTDAAKAAHLDAQDAKLETITREVCEVKAHTNGILDKLVDAATDKDAPKGE